MHFVQLIALFAGLVSATPLVDLSPRRATGAGLTTAAPTIVNGNFEAPDLHTGWRWQTLGARVSRATYNTNNHALRYENINCENEDYVQLTGHLQNIVPGRNYSLSFRFMYAQGASGVDWSYGLYPTNGCDPCVVTLFDHVSWPKRVQAGKWAVWTGTFRGPGNVHDGKVSLDLEPYTCGYRGYTLLDGFVVKEVA